MAQRRLQACRTLREIDHFDAALDIDVIALQMLREQAFGLRLLKKDQIRITRLQRIEVEAREALPVLIEIRDARAMAEFEKRLDHAMLLEEFQRARLNADRA
jgi:hypothetical protein